jgi:Mn2+/Fe2+ NRAMP family transporter
MTKITLVFWIKILFIVLLYNAFIHQNLHAYAGLGPLIPIIANIIVYIFLFIVAVLGVIIYPMKLFLNKFRNKNKNRDNENSKK